MSAIRVIVGEPRIPEAVFAPTVNDTPFFTYVNGKVMGISYRLLAKS